MIQEQQLLATKSKIIPYLKIFCKRRVELMHVCLWSDFAPFPRGHISSVDLFMYAVRCSQSPWDSLFSSPQVGGTPLLARRFGIVALGTWPRATGQKLMGAELDIWHIMATLFTACP